MRSGYSSRTLEISNVPIPAPVPPPREWQSWKPCRPHLLSCQTRKSDLYLCIWIVHNTGEEIKLETTVWICLAKWQLQLYYSRQASVASLCFFSDNIKYWVNQLSTFGVVTLTGFFNYKLMKNHTKLKPRTQPCLCPIVARTCPTIQTTESNPMAIQHHNLRHLERLWRIWEWIGCPNRLQDPRGKEISNQNALPNDIPSPACLPKDKVIWAKQLAKWTSTNTVHGACKGIKLDSSKQGVKSEVRGLSSLKPGFGKNQYMLFNIMLYTWYDMWYIFWTTIV